MKLPGIEYTSNAQSIQTESVGTQLSIASSKRGATEAAVGAVRAASKAIYDIASSEGQKEAILQLNKNWNDYSNEMGMFEQNLLSKPYDVDQNNNPVSRHNVIGPEYIDHEKQLRDQISSEITNPVAAREFKKFADKRHVEGQQRVMNASIQWRKDDLYSQTQKAIDDHMNNNRYDDAEKAFLGGVAIGIYNKQELINIPKQIYAHKQFGVTNLEIKKANDVRQYRSIRETITNPSSLPDISDAQRRSLESALNQKIEDDLSEATRAVIETQGLEAGFRFIHGVNATDVSRIGFTSDEDKVVAVGRLQQIFDDYTWGLKKGEKEDKVNMRVTAIELGAPADRKDGTDKEAMDIVFQKYTEGEVPFSKKYMDQTMFHAVTQGWVPPSVESNVRAYLDHGNPRNVVDAANALIRLDQEAPRSVENTFTNDDIAFGLMVNEYSRHGVPPVETISKIRDGIYRVPNTVKDTRKLEFDVNIKKDSMKILEGIAGEDSKANPLGPWNMADIPLDAKGDFERIFKDEFIRTGNQNVASRMAYKIMRKSWGVTNIGGDKRLEYKSPEAVLGDGGIPQNDWMNEQWKSDIKSQGMDPDKYTLTHTNINGKDRWIILDKENLDAVINKDGQMMMIEFDYAKSPVGINDRRESLIKRAQAKWRKQREQRYAEGVMKSGVDSVSKASKLGTEVSKKINTGAVRTWEFILDDVPEAIDSYTLPHNRPMFKKMREELKAKKERDKMYPETIELNKLIEDINKGVYDDHDPNI